MNSITGVFQANKWCNKGVELLSNLPPEHCHSAEDTRSAIEDIESFMSTSNQLRLNNPKEFRQLFESMITPETRVSLYYYLQTECHKIESANKQFKISNQDLVQNFKKLRCLIVEGIDMCTRAIKSSLQSHRIFRIAVFFAWNLFILTDFCVFFRLWFRKC